MGVKIIAIKFQRKRFAAVAVAVVTHLKNPEYYELTGVYMKTCPPLARDADRTKLLVLGVSS